MSEWADPLTHEQRLEFERGLGSGDVVEFVAPFTKWRGRAEIVSARPRSFALMIDSAETRGQWYSLAKTPLKPRRVRRGYEPYILPISKKEIRMLDALGNPPQKLHAGDIV